MFHTGRRKEPEKVGAGGSEDGLKMSAHAEDRLERTRDQVKGPNPVQGIQGHTQLGPMFFRQKLVCGSRGLWTTDPEGKLD